MKKILFAVCVSLIAIAVIILVLRHQNKSYISFEKDCIEVKATIEEVAEKTIREFPECVIKNRGKLFNSDFIYGRCGNNAVNMTEFLIAADKHDCEAFSSMGRVQRHTTIMKATSDK